MEPPPAVARILEREASRARLLERPPPHVARDAGHVLLRWPRIAVSTLLSFVGGYLDAAMFIALQRLFTANVTGNLVYVVAVGMPPAARRARLVITAVWGCGAALAGLCMHVVAELWPSARSRKSVTMVLLVGELLALLTLLTAGLVLAGRVAALPAEGAEDAWPLLVLGCLSSSSMGWQTALVRELLTPIPPTTVMTTVLAATLLAGLDALFSLGRHSALAHERALRALVENAAPVTAFVFGAASGAWLQQTIGFAAVAVPIAAVGYVLVLVAASSGPPPPFARRSEGGGVAMISGETAEELATIAGESAGGSSSNGGGGGGGGGGDAPSSLVSPPRGGSNGGHEPLLF